MRRLLNNSLPVAASRNQRERRRGVVDLLRVARHAPRAVARHADRIMFRQHALPALLKVQLVQAAGAPQHLAGGQVEGHLDAKRVEIQTARVNRRGNRKIVGALPAIHVHDRKRPVGRGRIVLALVAKLPQWLVRGGQFEVVGNSGQCLARLAPFGVFNQPRDELTDRLLASGDLDFFIGVALLNGLGDVAQFAGAPFVRKGRGQLGPQQRLRELGVLADVEYTPPGRDGLRHVAAFVVQIAQAVGGPIAHGTDQVVVDDLRQVVQFGTAGGTFPEGVGLGIVEYAVSGFAGGRQAG